MAKYEFNDRIIFELPKGFVHVTDKDEEGEITHRICCEKYINDDGEEDYKHDYPFSLQVYKPDEVDSDWNSDNLIEKRISSLENAKSFRLSNEPEAFIVNCTFSVSVFGLPLNVYQTICMIKIGDWEVFDLSCGGTFDDNDQSKTYQRVENFFKVLESVRIDDKRLQLKDVSSLGVFNDILISFGEDNDAHDITPDKYNVKFVSSEGFTLAFPDSSLYPHYDKLKNNPLGSLPGVTFVVNATGTEYQFIPLSSYIDDDEVEEDNQELCKRILAKDKTKYDLYDKAKEMQRLFHVNKEVFDAKHDRECELEAGLMHRAYMMSGLRSFAWTLADYCEHNDCDPEDTDPELLSELADFVAEQDWLNYNGTSFCKGLCSGSDLHVYYLPDGISKADKEKLLPGKEDYDYVKLRKSINPSYRPMLSEIRSLDALRDDLKYIYPAVRALWEKLAEERDYDEPLVGNEADIVYAWCALAMAAKEPFLTEDGPMNCWFDQINEEISVTCPQTKTVENNNNESLATSAVNDEDFYIEDGILSEYYGGEKNIVFPKVMITKIDDDCFSDSDVETVIIPEGVTAIGVRAFSDCKKLRKVVLPSTLKEISDSAFCHCEKLEAIDFPKGLSFIGDCAFGWCESIKELRIPGSVKNLGSDNDDPFFGMHHLESVYIEDGVESLGNILSCTNYKELFVPSSVKSIHELIQSPQILHTVKGSFAEKWFREEDMVDEICTDYGFNNSANNSSNLNVSGLINSNGSSTTNGVSDDDFDIENGVLSGYYGGEKNIVFPKIMITKIDDACFSGTDIETVIIPEGVISIGESAFDDCKKLKKVVLPSTLKEIGYSAFCHCEKLEAIVFPKGLSFIGDCAFGWCESIKELRIPGSVKNLGSDNDDPFFGMDSLEKVYIEDGVESLGHILSCSNYKELFVPSSVKSIHELIQSPQILHTVKGSFAEKWFEKEGIVREIRTDYSSTNWS